MKKLVVATLCVASLGLTACSKGHSPQKQFVAVCDRYVAAGEKISAAMNQAQAQKPGAGQKMADGAALMLAFREQIQKPYGKWVKACFTGVPTKGRPVCTALTKLVSKSQCGKETAISYKALAK
jgi:hypothetical protein